jgi:para-aminobenzoate synthetase component 1
MGVMDGLTKGSVNLCGQMNLLGRRGVPFLFAINYELDNGFVIEKPLQQQEVLFRVPGYSNCRDNGFNDIPEGVGAKGSGVVGGLPKVLKSDSLKEYTSKFQVIMNGLHRGDTYLANLTCRSQVSLPLPSKDVFMRSSSAYGLYVPGQFLCYSPERFVRIEGRNLCSSPMKGTIDTSVPNAERQVLEDYKEKCEHNTIVDLIRNDVGIICDKVFVDSFRYTTRINTGTGELLQVSSDIRGILPSASMRDFGNVIFSMLPAGSVSGAPKGTTCQIIRQAEGVPRGFYTGIFGYFDGKVLDSAVLIRFIEIVADEQGNESFYYRSGGGITINSNCEQEYREMLSKIYIPVR